MIEHIKGLAIFAKVAETRSFRGAARALSLSPSVVSQHIATLESRLGVALIYRSTRNLTLTPDGEALLEPAQSMVAEAEAGLARLSGVAADPVGELHIALPEAMSLSPIADDLAAFSSAHPGVTLRTAFSDARHDPIREGYDLAIRVGWLEDSALKTQKLGEVQRILVASAAYAAERTPPAHPEDLNGWDFIRFASVRNQPVLHREGHRSCQLRMQSRILASSGIAAYRFARAGAGVTMILEFVALEDIKAGAVVHLLPEWRAEPAGIYAVWPPNAPRHGLAMRLLGFLRTRIAARQAG